MSNNWVPLANCVKITAWRRIQTLRNHICQGIVYPFLRKDAVGNRWLGNDEEFTNWLEKETRSSKRR